MRINSQLVNCKTTEGLNLLGLLSPNSKERIIIYIHGLASEFYSDSIAIYFLQNLSKQDPSFVSTENRGDSGVKYLEKNRKRFIGGSAYEKFEDSVYDVGAWIDWAETEGYKEIWTMSHSFGPSKVVYYFSEKDDQRASGHIFISPSEVYGAVRDEDGIADHKVMYREAKNLVRQNKGDSLLSKMLFDEVYMSAKTYLSWFDEESVAPTFNYFKPELGWDRVNKIDVPVLAITGSKDDGIVTVCDPYKGMEILEKELKNSPRVKTVVLDGADHGFGGYYEDLLGYLREFINS